MSDHEVENYETFYQVKVIKVTKGIKKQMSFEKLYDSEHPKMKEENPPEQYGYKEVKKSFSENETIFEQRADDIDLPRILRAMNRDL